MKGKQNKMIAETVAEFVVKTKYKDLPKETVDQVKHYILDCVGCMTGAGKEPQAQALLKLVKAEGGKPNSSVFGQGFKTSAMNAAV